MNKSLLVSSIVGEKLIGDKYTDGVTTSLPLSAVSISLPLSAVTTSQLLSAATFSRIEDLYCVDNIFVILMGYDFCFYNFKYLLENFHLCVC